MKKCKYEFEHWLFEAVRSCRDAQQFEAVCRKYIEKNHTEDVTMVFDCQKYCNSIWSRMKRCRKRINEMINHFPYVYFITFTVDDKKATGVTEAYMSRKAKDVLRFVDGCEYVLNEDYGENSGRFHLHCVLSCIFTWHNVRMMLTDSEFGWPYGNVDIKAVHKDDKSVLKLRNYITKLVRHAYKGTTGEIWYSRKNYEQRNKSIDNYLWL